MVTRATIDEFVAQRTLALAGASRDGKTGFGNVVRKELPKRGYVLRLLHPQAETIDGQPCARRLADVAAEVGGLVCVTPSAASEALVTEAAEAGIRRIWLQQGAESPEAIQRAEAAGISVVHGHCILMFTEPTGFLHGLHRWFLKLFGGMPQ